MVNRPFRVAFWALAVNVGLSLCWLASDPETARLALQASAAPRPDAGSIEPRPVLTADASTRSNSMSATASGSLPASPGSAPPAVETIAPIGPTPGRQPEGAVIADSGAQQPPFSRIVPETPPLPIREVSASNEGSHAWVLHDGSRTTFGTGKFEELPPPPEFADETTTAAPGARTAESDHETATQLAGLGERLDDLHGELAELRTSQAAVERTLTELAALKEPPAAATRPSAGPIEIQAVVMQAPLTGELRDGMLPALQRSGAAGEISVDDESRRDVSWGVCQCDAGVVAGWLQRTAATGRMAQRTLRLMPDATAALDLWRLLPPRMVQARGPYVFERAPRPDWGGALELRCPGCDAAGMELEFRSRGTAETAAAASSDWRLTTIPAGGTLVVTGPCDEQIIRRGGDANRELPHEQPVGRSEIVVILSARRAGSPDDSLPKPARLLPLIDAPELPLTRE